MNAVSPGLTRLGSFTATLRANGFAVGLGEAADAARVMASPLAARPEWLFEALRALFCADAEQWARFRQIFDASWREQRIRHSVKSAGASRSGGRQGESVVANLTGAGDGGAAGSPGRSAGASAAEALDRVDFRKITDPALIDAAHARAARLAALMRARLVRRMRRARSGRRLDLRRTIRASVSHGGVPLALSFRRRRVKPLKLVLLLDASGSMSLYTAAFTAFMHGVIRHFRQSDAFLFHTRLVQVADAMRERNTQRAIDRLSLLAEGVGGGTRIGECLAAFERRHAKRALAGRSVLMIVSDGYDTGEAGTLGAAMRALRRRCRRIVWLNPMMGWDGYAPVARGMSEALPYIDLFSPAHNLESLAKLEPYLERL